MPEVEILRGTVETADTDTIIGLDGAPIPSAAVQAAILQTAGERDAAVLKAADTRDAAVLRTGSQRRINLIWEVTQAVVTIMVVGATLFIAGSLVIRNSSNAGAAFLLLSNAFFMIVTAYYQRTNHTRTGGVGGDQVREDR